MIKPMLCQLRAQVWEDTDWVWEKKQDGERAIIVIEHGVQTIWARSGVEKTAQYPEIKLTTASDCILDGEMVAATGKFQDIQHRVNRQTDILQAAREYPVKYVAFDLLSASGIDRTGMSLVRRTQALVGVLRPSPCVEISQWSGDGLRLWQTAQAEGWEGVIGKRLLSVYQPGKRSKDWVKVKVNQEGIFSCVGYTLGLGKREGLFGALVLENGAHVGTGFTDEQLLDVQRFLDSREHAGLSRVSDDYVQVRPFKVRVKYLEVTNVGSLRFPVFMGVVD